MQPSGASVARVLVSYRGLGSAVASPADQPAEPILAIRLSLPAHHDRRSEEPVPRHIVCLTFDFDTQSGFIARGLTTPTALSRGEFGLIGARRILALLKSRRLRSTWFTPGFTIESHPE